MSSAKIKYNVCRICLEHKAHFNWNDEIFEFSGVSYKYCYYKYTQMEETDANFYPTNLCDRCASEVKNAHALFEKALESFIILQNTVKTKGTETYQNVGKFSIRDLNQTCTLEDYNFVESRNNKRSHIKINKKTHNFEPSEIPTEEKSTNNVTTKNTSNPSFKKLKINKTKILESCSTTLELNIQLAICSPKLLNSSVNKYAFKTCKSLKQTSLKKSQRQIVCSRRKVEGTTTIQRIQFSEQSPKTNSLDNEFRSHQPSFARSVDKREHTFKPSTFYFDESCTNSSTQLSFQQLEQKPLVINISEKDKIPNKPLSFSMLEKKFDENYVNSKVQNFNTNSSMSKECEISSASNDSIKKTNSFKPSEISLLEQIYGKHFDIKSLKKKPKSKRSQPKEKICQYCSLKILGTNRLLAHEATHLEHRERNVICPKCGIKLYTKLALSEHIKTHDKNRQKKHKCEFCEKAFFHKGGLNVHRRIHLGLMVKCQMCPKEFYRQVDLDRHLPSHSASPLQNNSVKKIKYTVQCQYCNKSIMTNSWKAHKAAHLKQPQVKCKICNKDFYSRTSCVDHLHKVHRKTGSEYEENIHYYVDCTTRMSHLIMKQQEIVLPVV